MAAAINGGVAAQAAPDIAFTAWAHTFREALSHARPVAGTNERRYRLADIAFKIEAGGRCLRVASTNGYAMFAWHLPIEAETPIDADVRFRFRIEEVRELLKAIPKAGKHRMRFVRTGGKWTLSCTAGRFRVEARQETSIFYPDLDPFLYLKPDVPSEVMAPSRWADVLEQAKGFANPLGHTRFVRREGRLYLADLDAEEIKPTDVAIAFGEIGAFCPDGLGISIKKAQPLQRLLKLIKGGEAVRFALDGDDPKSNAFFRWSGGDWTFCLAVVVPPKPEKTRTRQGPAPRRRQRAGAAVSPEPPTIDSERSLATDSVSHVTRAATPRIAAGGPQAAWNIVADANPEPAPIARSIASMGAVEAPLIVGETCLGPFAMHIARRRTA